MEKLKYCDNDDCIYISKSSNDLQKYYCNREDLDDEECIKYLCKKCWHKSNTADILLYKSMNIDIKELYWID